MKIAAKPAPKPAKAPKTSAPKAHTNAPATPPLKERLKDTAYLAVGAAIDVVSGTIASLEEKHMRKDLPNYLKAQFDFYKDEFAYTLKNGDRHKR